MHDKNALIEHYQQMRAALLSAIDGLSDEQLIERSLDGWSVKDHLAHLVAWDEMRSAEIERISAGYDSAWRMSDAQEDAFNEICHEVRSDHSLSQIRWELDRTHRLIVAALAGATDRGLDEAHYAGPTVNSDHEAEHTGWILAWRERMGY